MIIAQFNDGLGWRGNRPVPAGATMEAAIQFAKEHYGDFVEGGQGRCLFDHLRLIEPRDAGDPAITSWQVIWWQDGATAEPKMGPI